MIVYEQAKEMDETAYLSYLSREGLYGTLFSECTRLRQKRGEDAAILLWRGFALGSQVG